MKSHPRSLLAIGAMGRVAAATLSAATIVAVGAVAAGCGSSDAPASTRSAAAVRSCPEVEGARSWALIVANATGETITLNVSSRWACSDGALGAYSGARTPDVLRGASLPPKTVLQAANASMDYSCPAGAGQDAQRHGAFELSLYAGTDKPTILPLNGRPSMTMLIDCRRGGTPRFLTIRPDDAEGAPGVATRRAMFQTTLPNGKPATVALTQPVGGRGSSILRIDLKRRGG